MASALQFLKASVSDCERIPFTNGTGGALTGGALHEEGDFNGIVMDDTPDGNEGVLITRVPPPGVYALKAAVAIAIHDSLYYDATNDVVTNTDNTGANAFIGKSLAAAASGDARVWMSLTNDVAQ